MKLQWLASGRVVNLFDVSSMSVVRWGVCGFARKRQGIKGTVRACVRTLRPFSWMIGS